MEWLASGLRRDVCILLHGDEHRAQKLKSALESHYDRRIPPERFYGALSALEAKGVVKKRVEGLSDVYSLTEAGRNSVERQFRWMNTHVSPNSAG